MDEYCYFLDLKEDDQEDAITEALYGYYDHIRRVAAETPDKIVGDAVDVCTCPLARFLCEELECPEGTFVVSYEGVSVLTHDGTLNLMVQFLDGYLDPLYDFLAEVDGLYYLNKVKGAGTTAAQVLECADRTLANGSWHNEVLA